MKILRLPQTKSTNSFAVNLLSQKRPDEGYVVITNHQTDGKGLEANSWESEAGKNLTFSIILYPDFAAEQQFILNKAISLGIYEFLQKEIHDVKVSVKWPNDIYLDNKKVCGILVQNSLIGNRFDYTIVGIGLNVNQTHFLSDAPNPVSMKMINEKEYNLEELLNKLLDRILLRYYQVKTAPKKIEKDYQKALFRVMEWCEYEVKKSRVYGRITGTNEYGQLLLETESGPVLICDLKEIKFLF
ncbi:MAG: biotin--[acetyl-CoA-carboxylase] ligase [Bacteroidales bacterium]